MGQEFTYLNRPISAGGRTIKNRIAVPAMADFGMTEKDGLVNQRHLERYGAYAEGGAGLVIIEACAVSKLEEPRNTIGVYEDGCMDGLKRLAEAAKKNGAAALVQLMNTGLSAMPYSSIAEIPEREFKQYHDDFIQAAIRCQKAGFDGAELHAAHGMYLNQVLETSTRTDGYGGAFENRIRLLRELICEIREACGSGFLLAVRFGNRDPEELVRTAQVIQEAGGDLLDVSTGMGSYTNVPPSFAFDGKLYAASLVKQKSDLPVIGVGNIFTGEQAEQALEKGLADMIAVGRGHLADPAWAGKVLSGENPVPCRRCKRCLWYVDGRKCPAARERRER